MNSFIEKISSHISFFDICFDDNYGWFCDAYTNTLYRINLLTNKITVEAGIPAYGDVQYGFIARWENMLVLAPRAARKIMIYHIKEYSFTEIELDIGRMEEREVFNLFAGVQIFGDSAYLIPGRFPAVVRLDLHTFEIEYFDSWYERLKSKIKNYNNGIVFFARCNCVFDGKLLLPCWQANIVMEFQFETGKYRFIEFPKIKHEFSGMYVRNKELFLASKSQHIIFRCDFNGNELERIKLRGLLGTGISYLIDMNGAVAAVPMSGGPMVQYDFNTERCEVILDLATEEKEDSYVGEIFPKVNILSAVRDNCGNLWLYSVFDDIILKRNINTGYVERIKAVLSEKEAKKKAFLNLQTAVAIWEECKILSIADLCDYIKEKEQKRKIQAIEKETSGKRINKTILGA